MLIPTSISVGKQFMASEQVELIDALGERVQTLGGVALARAGACPPSLILAMWQKSLRLSALPTALKKYP